MKRNFFLGLITIIIITLLTKCVTYSFTGASISPEVKSVEVQYFENRADIVNPKLTQLFTNNLKDKFISQTNLDLVNSKGDLVFSGYIKSYDIVPVAIQGNQTAAMNRLSVTIQVNFINKVEPENSFEQTFSFKNEYRSDLPLTEIDNSILPIIVTALVEDVFNKAVVNW